MNNYVSDFLDFDLDPEPLLCSGSTLDGLGGVSLSLAILR